MSYNQINSSKKEYVNRLRQLRSRVEMLDTELILLLKKRFALTSMIQKTKKSLQIPLTQLKREKKLLSAYVRLGKKEGLNPLLIKKLFILLFSYAKKTGIMKRIKKTWKPLQQKIKSQ